MTLKTVSISSFLLLVSLTLAAKAHADTVLSGTFTSDDQVYQSNFSTSTAQSYSFFTTSYGGGMNVNGTSTPAGGFVPVLTLFTGSGDIIGSSTTGGAVDPVTGLSDDAYLSAVLNPGSYTLTLTEFPNVAIGNLSQGFLFAGMPDLTGSFCGGGGPFLEADVAPCVQRNGDYTLNITSAAPTPEPASWVLLLSGIGILLGFRRRMLA